MGSSLSKKEALAIIASPENKEELERLFRDFDKDKNGALDAKEWQAFGKLLWEVDVEQANEAGRQEAIEVGQQRSQEVRSAMGIRARPQAPAFLEKFAVQRRYAPEAKLVKPTDVNAWITSMFEVADKDTTGSISFDEFYSFLQKESRQEAEKQKDNVIVAVNDPHARFVAGSHRIEELISAPSKAANAYVMGGIQPGSVAAASTDPHYTPGEINPIVLNGILSCPEMKAQYDTNKPLVTEFYAHQYDQARCNNILAANPEFAKAHSAMNEHLYRQQQEMMAARAAGGNPYIVPGY